MLNHSSYLPFSTSNNSFDSAFSCIQLESDFLLFPSSVSTPTASHRVINPFGKCFLHFTTAELRFGSSQARLNGCFMGWIQSVGSDACAWCLRPSSSRQPKSKLFTGTPVQCEAHAFSSGLSSFVCIWGLTLELCLLLCVPFSEKSSCTKTFQNATSSSQSCASFGGSVYLFILTVDTFKTN